MKQVTLTDNDLARLKDKYEQSLYNIDKDQTFMSEEHFSHGELPYKFTIETAYNCGAAAYHSDWDSEPEYADDTIEVVEVHVHTLDGGDLQLDPKQLKQIEQW